MMKDKNMIINNNSNGNSQIITIINGEIALARVQKEVSGMADCDKCVRSDDFISGQGIIHLWR